MTSRSDAAEQPQPVSGWRLVPVEPTEAMIEAGWRSGGEMLNGRPVWKLTGDVQARLTYQRMIAAAPPPPAAAVTDATVERLSAIEVLLKFALTADTYTERDKHVRTAGAALGKLRAAIDAALKEREGR